MTIALTLIYRFNIIPYQNPRTDKLIDKLTDKLTDNFTELTS